MLVNIYNNSQTIIKEFDTFCYQNCIKQILEYYDIKNPMLYINTSMSMIFKKNSIYDCYYDYEGRSVLPRFINNIINNKDIDTYNIWNNNLEYLHKGFPLIVKCDSYYLPYTSNYHKKHGRHSLILAGYNYYKNIVTIIDWSTLCTYKGDISLDIFLQARSSQNKFDGNRFSGIPINNEWSIIKRNNWEQDNKFLIKDLFKLSINQYYEVESYEEPRGIYAIKETILMLNEVNEFTLNKQIEFLKKFHFALFRIIRRKKLFCYYIFSSIGLVKDNEYLQFYNYICNIYNEWDYILKIIIKSIYKQKSNINKLIEKFNLLYYLEENLYYRLYKLYLIL